MKNTEKTIIAILTIMLCALIFTETVFAGDTKGSILQMTATLENSTTELQFNYAENIDDERGITFGCVGFTTGTYDGNELIKYYTELNSNNILKKYIPALDKIDVGPHYGADGDGNPDTTGLSDFVEDVNNCNDPLFKKAQLDKVDELYYNPAVSIYDSIGAEYKLTLAFIYDMCVRHGENGTKNIVSEATSALGGTPKTGVNEKTYLLKLIGLRDIELKNEGLGDVNRTDGYKMVLSTGNVNLGTPFLFTAYGDEFEITGDLGVDTLVAESTPNITASEDKVSFKDVAEDAWYSKAVSFAAARDITTGTGDGNYNPEGLLIRGQFITMLMRAYGINPDEESNDNFVDAGDTYYTCYIAAAKNKGITNGIGNNMFAPEKEITRQEMFTLLYNTLKQMDKLPTKETGKTLTSYSDSNDIASWAKDAMELFVGTGIISGSDGKLKPADPINRAQMAQVLYNLLSAQGAWK